MNVSTSTVCPNFQFRRRGPLGLQTVIYTLMEIEIETEKKIISLMETKREMEMCSKTETKYK